MKVLIRSEQHEQAMLTKIMLDEKLIEQAQELTGITTKDEAVQEALRALISLRQSQPAATPQQVVVESLERSLNENAEIWTELAKR
jgi:Arc/MetJ family transcription regulator